MSDAQTARRGLLVCLALAACTPQYGSNELDLGGSQAVLTPATIALDGSTQLSLTVRRQDGQPVPELHLGLTSTCRSVRPAIAVTDAHGQATFYLSGCPLGPQRLAPQVLLPDASLPLPAIALLEVANVANGPAVHLLLQAPRTAVVAGQAFDLQVTALDAEGRVATGYAGQLVFNSSDRRAMLPIGLTCSGGQLATTAILTTVGVQDLSVADGTQGTLLAALPALLVAPGPAANAVFNAPQAAVAGSSFVAQLSLIDAFGNPASNFTGTVTLASDDRQASNLGTLPVAQGAVAVALPPLTLFTAGVRRLDAFFVGAGGSLTATHAIALAPAAASQLRYLQQPGGATTGLAWPDQPVLQIADGYGNAVTGGANAVAPVSIRLLASQGSLGGTAPSRRWRASPAMRRQPLAYPLMSRSWAPVYAPVLPWQGRWWWPTVSPSTSAWVPPLARIWPPAPALIRPRPAQR